MFSTKEFIEASRDFVCVRLETFENKEHEQLVRKILHGRFANTAFCVLAPDGEEMLTRSSRGPSSVLGSTGRGPAAESGSTEDVIEEMEAIAKQFRPRGDAEEAVLQNFHTFRQALNVAAGDQRLLVFVAANESGQADLQESLKPVFNSDEVIGKFHLDFANLEKDKDWSKAISGAGSKPGIFVIQADSFGQEGKLVANYPLTTDVAQMTSSLLAENTKFAENEERKIYSDHVIEGRRKDIYFENEIPYGEDRDGDGEIDGGGKGKGKGGKGKGKGK